MFFGEKLRKREKKNPTPPRNSRGIIGGVGKRELLSLNVFDTLPDYEAIMGIIYSVKPTILRRSIIHYQ